VCPAGQSDSTVWNRLRFSTRRKPAFGRNERRLTDRLADRFDVSPSDAPYLLLELGGEESVPDLTATLRESNITVRDARTFRGLDNHVRVTVRSPEENDALLDALDV